MSGRDPFDLGRVIQDDRFHFEVRTLETAAERNARLQRQLDLAQHRRQVFWAVFAVVILAALVALLVVLFSENQENTDWARTLFSATIAGLVGYVVGGGGINSAEQ